MRGRLAARDPARSEDVATWCARPLPFPARPHVEQAAQRGRQPLVGAHDLLGLGQEQRHHPLNGFQALRLLAPASSNVAELPDDGLCSRSCWAGDRMENGRIRAKLTPWSWRRGMFSASRGEFENASARVSAALVLTALDLQGDFPELLLDNAEVSLQLLEHGDGRAETAPRACAGLIAGDGPFGGDARPISWSMRCFSARRWARRVSGSSEAPTTRSVRVSMTSRKPRLGADEAVVAGEDAVEEGENVLGVRRELIGRLVVAGLEERCNQRVLTGAPGGEGSVARLVAERSRIAFLNVAHGRRPGRRAVRQTER